MRDRRTLRRRAAAVLLCFVAELCAPLAALAARAHPPIHVKYKGGTFELNYGPARTVRAGLMEVPGIGPKTADAILRARPFRAPADVRLVSGVRKPAAQSLLNRVGANASPGARRSGSSPSRAKLPEIKAPPKPKVQKLPEVWVRTQRGRVNLNHPNAHRVAVELIKGGVARTQVNALMQARAKAIRGRAPLASKGAYARAASSILGDPFAIDASGNISKPKSVQVAERRARFQEKLAAKKAAEAKQKARVEARKVKDTKAREAAAANRTRIIDAKNKANVTVSKSGVLELQFHNGKQAFRVNLNHGSSPQLYQRLVDAGMSRSAALEVARARSKAPFRTAADFRARAPSAARVISVRRGMLNVEVQAGRTGARAKAPNTQAPESAKTKGRIRSLEVDYARVRSRAQQLSRQPLPESTKGLQQRYNQLRTEYNRMYKLRSQIAELSGKPLSNARMRSLPEMRSLERGIRRVHQARDNAVVRQRAQAKVQEGLRGLRARSAKTSDPKALERIRAEARELVQQEARLRGEGKVAGKPSVSSQKLLTELDGRLEAARKVKAGEAREGQRSNREVAERKGPSPEARRRAQRTRSRAQARQLIEARAEGNRLMNEAVKKFGKSRGEVFRMARSNPSDPLLQRISRQAELVNRLRAQRGGPSSRPSPRRTARSGRSSTRSVQQKVARTTNKIGRVEGEVRRAAAEHAGKNPKQFQSPEKVIEAAQKGQKGPVFEHIRNLQKQIRATQVTRKGVQQQKIARKQARQLRGSEPPPSPKQARVRKGRSSSTRSRAGSRPSAPSRSGSVSEGGSSQAPRTRTALNQKIGDLNTEWQKARTEARRATDARARQAAEAKARNLRAQMESFQQVRRGLAKEKVQQTRRFRRGSGESRSSGETRTANRRSRSGRSAPRTVEAQLQARLDTLVDRVIRRNPSRWSSKGQVMEALRSGTRVSELQGARHAYNQLRYEQLKGKPGASPSRSGEVGESRSRPTRRSGRSSQGSRTRASGGQSGPAAPKEGTIGAERARVNDALTKEAARLYRQDRSRWRSPEQVREAARSGDTNPELRKLKNLQRRMADLEAQRSVKGRNARADAREGSSRSGRNRGRSSSEPAAEVLPDGKKAAVEAGRARFDMAMKEALRTGKYRNAGEVYRAAHEAGRNAPPELRAVQEAATEIARARGRSAPRPPAEGSLPPRAEARGLSRILSEFGFGGKATHGVRFDLREITLREATLRATNRGGEAPAPEARAAEPVEAAEGRPLGERITEVNNTMQREAARVAREYSHRYRSPTEVIRAAESGANLPELEGERNLRGEMRSLQEANRAVKQARVRGGEPAPTTEGARLAEGSAEGPWYRRMARNLGWEAAPAEGGKWNPAELFGRRTATEAVPVEGAPEGRAFEGRAAEPAVEARARGARGYMQDVTSEMGWTRGPNGEAIPAEAVEGRATEGRVYEGRAAEGVETTRSGKSAWRSYWDGVGDRLGVRPAEARGMQNPLGEVEPVREGRPVEARAGEARLAEGAVREGFVETRAPELTEAGRVAEGRLAEGLETGRFAEGRYAEGLETGRVAEGRVAEGVEARASEVAEPARSRWSFRADMWQGEVKAEAGETMWQRIKNGFREAVPKTTAEAKAWDPVRAHFEAEYAKGGPKNFVDQFQRNGARLPVEGPVEAGTEVLEPLKSETARDGVVERASRSAPEVAELEARSQELRGKAHELTREAVRSGEAKSPVEAIQKAEALQAEGKVEVRASETAKPGEAVRASETVKPGEGVRATEAARVAEPGKVVEAGRVAETVRVAETAKPVEAGRVAETARVAETGKVVEPGRVVETAKPVETARAVETAKPVEVARTVKPGEAVKAVEPVKAGEAKVVELARTRAELKAVETAKVETVARQKAAAETAMNRSLEAGRATETARTVETARPTEAVRTTETAKPTTRSTVKAGAKQATAAEAVKVAEAAPGRPAHALGLQGPNPGALEVVFNKGIVDVARMTPRQIQAESGGLISAESAAKIAEVSARNGGKLSVAELSRAGVPAAEVSLLQKGAQQATQTRIGLAEARLATQADALVKAGKYSSRQAALKGAELAPMNQKLQTLRSANAKGAGQQGQATARTGELTFNSADPVQFHQAKAQQYKAQIEGLKASSGKGILGRIKRFTNNKKIASLEAQMKHHEAKAAELAKADKAVLAQEKAKLDYKPHQAKTIKALEAQLAKVDPNSRYGRALQERIHQMKSTPGENYARTAGHLVAIAIGTNLFFNVWRQIKEDGTVDIGKAAQFLTTKEFWLSTAGLVGGTFAGMQVAKLTMWELLSTRVMGFTPLGGTFMRLLPLFAGGAIGAQLLGGGLQDADWGLVGAHTLGSTLGTAIAISMLAAGPIGQLVGAIAGGMIAEKVLEMIRGEGPEAEAQGRDEADVGAAGDGAGSGADVVADGAFTHEDVNVVFEEMQNAYKAYTTLEDTGKYGEAAAAYERYAGLKRQLDSMRQVSYAARGN